MADATKTVEIIFQGTNKLGTSLANVEDGLSGLGDDAEKAEDALGGVGDEVEKLGGKSVAVDRLNTALKALAVALVVDRFIDVNVAAERFQKTMEFATGSAQEAAKEYEYVSGVADRFGLSLTNTASAYSKFISGTKGSVLSTQELKATFEGVAGTLSLVGSSSQDVEEALRQMTQGIGKNRFELEDLKSIAERVPGGMFAIADALGITTEALYENITAGEFGAEQIRIYAETLNNDLNGISFDTFENALNRMNNAITSTLILLGDTGVMDAFTLGISAVTVSVVGLASLIEISWVQAKSAYDQLKSLAPGGKTPLEALEEGSLALDAVLAKTAKNAEQAGAQYLRAWDNMTGGTDTSVKAIKESVTALGEVWEVVTEGTGEATNAVAKFNGVELDAAKLNAQFEGVGETAKKTTTEIEKAYLKLLEIESDERIANIEAAVTLDVAGIEASAEIAVANIESIGTAVEATTDLLGSLFGNLLDAETFTQQFLIEDQIKLQNERLADQDKIQQRLAEATIRELNARTRRLSAGDAIITVNGDGLQPHLEAIMFELLGAIQTKVNADGYGLLLGTP